MSAKKSYKKIKVILLIILFLSYYLSLSPTLCDAICLGNQTVESDHCPLNSQTNCIDKFDSKAKEQSFCCPTAPKFAVVNTIHPDNQQSAYDVISTNYYHSANPNKNLDVQKAEKFAFLDHPRYLSHQVLLI